MKLKFSDLRPGDMIVLKVSSNNAEWYAKDRTKGLLMLSSCVSDQTLADDALLKITFLTLWCGKGLFREAIEHWYVTPHETSDWWMRIRGDEGTGQRDDDQE